MLSAPRRVEPEVWSEVGVVVCSEVVELEVVDVERSGSSLPFAEGSADGLTCQSLSHRRA